KITFIISSNDAAKTAILEICAKFELVADIDTNNSGEVIIKNTLQNKIALDYIAAQALTPRIDTLTLKEKKIRQHTQHDQRKAFTELAASYCTLQFISLCETQLTIAKTINDQFKALIDPMIEKWEYREDDFDNAFLKLQDAEAQEFHLLQDTLRRKIELDTIRTGNIQTSKLVQLTTKERQTRADLMTNEALLAGNITSSYNTALPAFNIMHTEELSRQLLKINEAEERTTLRDLFFNSAVEKGRLKNHLKNNRLALEATEEDARKNYEIKVYYYLHTIRKVFSELQKNTFDKKTTRRLLSSNLNHAIFMKNVRNLVEVRFFNVLSTKIQPAVLDDKIAFFNFITELPTNIKNVFTAAPPQQQNYINQMLNFYSVNYVVFRIAFAALALFFSLIQLAQEMTETSYTECRRHEMTK
ncbi:MAG: hypothetical protein NTZ67_01290, partial [Gammaproteobacteria bacterium]|nr:hypothetical protein [Gammaproteobacteria bacterium]